MEETLYRRPEILFRWGDFVSIQGLRGGGRFHISERETLFRGRLYFVTLARIGGLEVRYASTLQQRLMEPLAEQMLKEETSVSEEEEEGAVGGAVE